MESILEKLKSLKPVIVGRYKVKGIELFGSYVRQEQSAGSDLDVLVDFREDADLIDLIGLGPRIQLVSATPYESETIGLRMSYD